MQAMAKKKAVRRYTAAKQRKLAVKKTPQKKKVMPKGRPFVKGDSRINRKGRPRTSDALRALVLDMLNEKKGKATRLQNMILDMAEGRNVIGKIEVLNRGYGKVADEVIFNTEDIRKIIDYLPDAFTERLAKGEPLGEVLIEFITSRTNGT